MIIEDNVSGKYYVNDDCINCNFCSESAPDNFISNDMEGYNYVKKQPETEFEEALCRQAMKSCPVNAIRDDEKI